MFQHFKIVGFNDVERATLVGWGGSGGGGVGTGGHCRGVEDGGKGRRRFIASIEQGNDVGGKFTKFNQQRLVVFEAVKFIFGDVEGV